MKLFLLPFSFFFIGVFVITGCQKSSREASTIRVMSYNIKFDDKADTLNGWQQRRERLVNLVAFYAPDFMGIQEGQHHQLVYMKQHLKNMDWIGKGREDGKTKGEYSAVFYNSDHFQLINHTDSTMWLSQTPTQPAKGWDASYIRILTWGKFRNKQTGREIYAFNTHLDNDGDTARVKSAELILETIKKVSDGFPVILTGDFNSTEADRPYAVITDSTSYLKDAFHTSALPPVGPAFSYDGFKTLGAPTEQRRIDYIFVNKQTEVLKYATISDFRDGRYPSDHMPVLADLSIHKK